MPTFEELLADLQAIINPSQRVSPQTGTDWIGGPNRFALPQGEMRSYEPSPGEVAGGAVNRMLSPAMGAGPAERVGGSVNRLLEFGPAPAQFATDVAMQPVRAGEAVGTAAADPTAGNIGKAGLETAITFAGPAGRAVRAGLTAAPRVTGAMLGGTTALAPSAIGADRGRGQRAATNEELTTEAERNADPLWQSVQDDPALAAKYSQMKEAERQATASVKGVNKESADAIRTQARELATSLLGEITDELARRNPPKMSFEDAYPAVSQNLPAIQAGTGVALGALMRSGGNIMRNIDDAPWRGAVRRGEAALDPSEFNRRVLRRTPNLERAEQQATKAAEFMKEGAGRNRLMDEVMPPVAAGVAGGEMSLFPHQYNLRNAPEGSPENQRAQEALGSVNAMLTTAARGAVPAALGGFTGTHLAPVPRLRPPVAETQALQANIARARAGGTSVPGGPNTGPTPGASPPSGAGAPPTISGARQSSGTAQGRLPAPASSASPSASPKPVPVRGSDGIVRWHDPRTGNWVSPPKRKK